MVKAPDYSLAAFRRFAAGLRTEAGEPLKILPFQAKLLGPYFAGTRETVIVLPTGNGKTTLLAALGLFHHLSVPNAQVLIVASAQDQAATLFKQMRTLTTETEYSPLLDVKGGQYRIYHKGDGPNRRPPGEIRVIASEVKRQEGAIPTLVLVDELHAHKDLQMYEMLRDKLWKRGDENGCGRMVAISTAGFTFASPLYRLTESVHELPTFKREGFCNRASGVGFEWYEYALAPDQDRDDLTLVAKANPAPWVTKAALAQRKASVTMSPGEWSRSACNVWTAGEEPAILPEEWDMLRADIGQIGEGEEVIMAPSVGGNAAVAVAAPRSEGRVAVKVFHVEPKPGRHIHALTEDLIVSLCERYEVSEVLCPEGGFAYAATNLEDRGVPVVAAHPSPSRLVGASGTFDRLLRERKIIHDGNETTRAQVLSAVKKITETGERYVPGDGSRAIGALAIAAHAVTSYEPPPLVVLPRRVG
jgi:phage terminase large subunit-like protein